MDSIIDITIQINRCFNLFEVKIVIYIAGSKDSVNIYGDVQF